MVKAGKPVDAVIEELTPLLDEGDIIIDAGNSHFPDTVRRTEECAANGIRFMGVGVSGGEEGALLGPSIMPGGDPPPTPRWRRSSPDRGRRRRHPVLRARRARRRRALREDGAQRHRVRRHPAHRRGLRPAHPRRGPGRPGHRKIFEQWNSGDLDSFLIEITAKVLREDRREDRRPAGRRDR
jgi:6-phosphogluconate dehydrogenase